MPQRKVLFKLKSISPAIVCSMLEVISKGNIFDSSGHIFGIIFYSNSTKYIIIYNSNIIIIKKLASLPIEKLLCNLEWPSITKCCLEDSHIFEFDGFVYK